MGKRNVIVMLFIVCLAGSAFCQPPSLISYQGKLVDSDGIPVTGTHDLQFDIYTSSTAGTLLWTETHVGVTITGGLFNVVLGATTAIDPDTLLDANAELWLEVTLDGSETFTRTRLLSAPYAMLASRLSGLDATASQMNELVGGGSTTLHSHPPADADTLDTLDSLQFLRADANATFSGGTLEVASGSTFNAAGTFQLGAATVNATAAQLNELVGGGATTLHSHAPGDATTLDGLDSAQFLRADVNDVCAGVIQFTGDATGYAPNQAAVEIYPSSVDSGDCLFSVWTSGTDMVVVSEPANLTVSGVIQAGTLLFEEAYNRLGSGTPDQAAIDAANDLLINGDLEVKGEVYWGAKTKYYSVLPAALAPGREDYTFVRGGSYLYKGSGDTNAQYYIAPVDLPDNAIVTELTVWYDDDHAADLTVELRRHSYGAWWTVTMASVSSSAGGASATDDTIPFGTINNDSSNCYLVLSFPSDNTYGDLEFQQARITYTTTEP